MGWHDAITYGIFRMISASVRAIRRVAGPKPCSHGVTGHCQECTDQAFSRSPAGIALARQQRLVEIYSAYSSIHRETRELLKSKVEDRIQRYHLQHRPGDLEAAVVRACFINRFGLRSCTYV
jgi:hypothetical protein